jgi:hypothetical protein
MTTMTDRDKKTRQSQWFAVAAFSTVALVALCSNFEGKIKDEDMRVKWAVSAISLALIFSALAVFAHILLKEKFANTAMEGGLVRMWYSRPNIFVYF